MTSAAKDRRAGVGAAAKGGRPERRRLVRRKAFWSAEMKTVFGTVECRVLDLSLRGAKVQVGVPVAVGQAVTLTLKPLGEFAGSIAWKRGAAIGIRFREQRSEGDWSRIRLGRVPAAKSRKAGAGSARRTTLSFRP